MQIKEYFDSISTPSTYMREGKTCYYDTFRKKLIEVTPEETVRQKIALMYSKIFGVPKEMIQVEVPLSHYVSNAKGRADIVIHAIDTKSHQHYPITVIECKNNNVLLTDNVMEQAMKYCDTIGGRYIVVTNGNELITAAYNKNTDNYDIIDSILSYSDMLNEKYEVQPPASQKIVRFSLEELKDSQLVNDYNNGGPCIYGADSSDKVKILSINLYQCLMDTDHTLPPIQRHNFKLIEDIGIRYMDYSNAGGGHYLGDYRAFLIKDRFGDTQIISMSLFGTDLDFRGENRRSYCSLVVAIDKFKISHNSLQYNVDSFCNFSNDGNVFFEHSGIIANRKKTEVINYVKKQSQDLIIQSDRIIIGRLKDDTLLYLDDSAVAELIYNFIEYALLREEMRRRSKE